MTKRAARRIARPRLDFREIQAKNRRRSFVLALCLVVVMAALGAALGAIWGQWLIGLGLGVVVAVVQYMIARRAGAAGGLGQGAEH